MRAFKTKWLDRFARREGLSDASLLEAISRAECGLIDADLGGGLIKQRVARPGRGRSGGYRLIVVYRARDRSVFIYGFAKNERENIGDGELQTMREVATKWLASDEDALHRAKAGDELKEIEYGEATQQPGQGDA